LTFIRRHICVVLAGAVLCGHRTAAAQQPQGEPSDSTAIVTRPMFVPRVARLGVWFAGGWHAPSSNYSPLPTDREVLVFGVERRFHLLARGGFDVSASPSLLPAVYTTGNRRQINVVCRDTYSQDF